MIALAIPRPELGGRAEARTKEVERCLKLGADWMLMVDLDQCMPDGAFQFFSEEFVKNWGSIGPDIYCLDAPSKGHDDSNVRYHPNGELAYATISCCLIRMSIFERLPRPWFRSDLDYREVGIKDGLIQWEVVDKWQDDNIGEDIYFMRQCIEQGIKIKIVPLKCYHGDLS